MYLCHLIAFHETALQVSEQLLLYLRITVTGAVLTLSYGKGGSLNRGGRLLFS